MRCALAIFAVSVVPIWAADGVQRDVLYAGASVGANDPIPTFDKGYLLFLQDGCKIAVYAPTGKLAFNQRLAAPGSRPCSALSAAVDSDGTVAVSIAYSADAGYAGGILLLDSIGKQTAFIETKRYMPSHICFDRQHAIWSIGWQRDQITNVSPDEQEHSIVRKFFRSGRESGAYIARSLWGRKGEPGAAGLGYWHIAAADDRIGAMVYEGHADNPPEWVEWGLDGKLLSRVRVPPHLEAGRAYTTSGRLYTQTWDKDAKMLRLRLLDRATGAWKPVSDYCTGRQGISPCGLLMGADGEQLVYRERTGGAVQLLWVRPEATGMTVQ